METPDLTKMMIEMAKDVQDIKTSLKYMTQHCEHEEACIQDIDVRLEVVENRFEQVDGAWKLILAGMSLGVFSFLIALYNWFKIQFGG